MSDIDRTNCDGCVFAEWNRTKNGRLHPSGDGRCKAPLPKMEIPAAFYWTVFSLYPTPSGGRIERRKPFSNDKECSFKKMEHE